MGRFLILWIIFCNVIYAEPYSFSIRECPYRFSTYFEIQGKKGFEGRAVKNALSLRTSYELYDSLGQYEALGVVQALSLGALFAWAKDIDIYDASGIKIGFVDGQALTTASAKYVLYNANNEWIATAYLDRASSGFLVTSAVGERTIAHLRRQFIPGTIDSWDISCFEPTAIDLRLLKIFSAFAVDYQEYFKEDN